MNLEVDTEIEEQEFTAALQKMFAPSSVEPTEDWAEKHIIVVEGPFAGSSWRLQFTLLAKWIFSAIRRSGVKRVVIMMSAQYVKTTVLLINFCRTVKEDPAPSMWVMAEADNIEEFWTKRLHPYIENCDIINPLFVSKRKALVQFETMNLMLRGSNSRAKLQSDPIRYVYCDERREWKKGAIDLLRKRMRAFPNALEISAGTAGVENDELHSDFQQGTQTRGHIRCLACQHSQPIRFGREVTALWKMPRECGGFIWETSERTKPEGHWDYDAVKATVRFECENPQCRAQYSNNEKYELLRTMHPHDYNPNPESGVVSFSGCAFEAVWESCDWDKLVEEFLKAVESARRGNIEPLKAFITETLGEPWQDQLGVIQDAGWLEARKVEYNFGEVWAEEQRRFMSADKQEAGGEHYFWVIRAFGFNGRSRLIAYGKASTKVELEDIRKKHNVSSKCAVIDSGFQAQEVYRFCLATGWKPFKGDDVQFYLERYPGKKAGEMVTVRQIWRRTKAAVYNKQTKARIAILPLFTFSTEGVKDALAEYMQGLVGEWTVSDKICRDYIKQMLAERREEKTDSRGQITYFWRRMYPENHYFDCELMIHVAALDSKTIAMVEKNIGGKKVLEMAKPNVPAQ